MTSTTQVKTPEDELRLFYNKPIPTVVFFPRWHPNVKLLIRRFSSAYHSPFIMRLLNYRELPSSDFRSGWNIVMVGKILEKEDTQKLSEMMWSPVLNVFFGNWVDPVFKPIPDPRFAKVTPHKAIKPKVVMPELDIVAVPANQPKPEAKKPVTKPKKPIVVKEEKKKEVVSMALLNSKRLTTVTDEQLLAAIEECRTAFGTARVLQANLIRCLLRTVFKQTFYRDPDVEYMTLNLSARMLSVKGAIFHKTSCSYSLKGK